MRHRIAVIGGDRLSRRFAEPVVQLDRSIAPTEHRLEMPSKGQIGKRHRIRRIESDGFSQQTGAPRPGPHA